MTQQNIVEAFKAYFQKSVMPYVNQNDEVMRQWSHLNKIISTDPIDYSQIEFYLLLANKSTGNLKLPRNNNYQVGSTDNIKDNSMKKSDFSGYGRERLNVSNGYNEEKKNSFIGKNSQNKKKLVSNLQNFQKVLLQSQQRLQHLSKTLYQNRTINQNSSVSSLPMRRY